MPKDTFANLPPDKRERFIDEALAEFSAQPYDSASLTRVVARLGIAKGSVYQYFDDKFDLFAWLVEESARRKRAFLGPPPQGADPVEHLAALYAVGLRWWVAEPAWARLGLRLLEPSAEPRLEALRHGARAASLGFVREILGERDPLLAPLVLAVLGDGLLAAFLDALGVDDPAALHARDPDDPEVAAAIARAVTTALRLLRHGLPA
jgi:TetR/AcrR family transcriptional regulator